MCVILFDHFSLVPLPEHSLPSITVLIAPTSIGFAHFPIGAHHSVPSAHRLSASELIPELYWNLFERCPRSRFKTEQLLPQ
jgi:hypothetical protein